jgi:cohesin domain-containing protein
VPLNATVSRSLPLGALALLLAGPAAAADATLSVQPASSRALPGQSFTVSVDLASVTDAYAFQFDVTFNPTLLRLTSVANAGFLPQDNFSGGIANADGSVRFVYDLLTGPVAGRSGGGTLATLTFETFADQFGSSPIHIGNVILVDAKGADIAVGVTDGSLSYIDAVPPVFQSARASPEVLWPANHKMVPVTVTASVADAVDPSPVTRILSVSSNEGADAAGDGHTEPDAQITGPLTVNLRAERSGTGSGRVYTITLESRDASDNASQRTVTVAVPHNP